MTISTFLSFDGNCREAVEFYGKAFGAKPLIMAYGDAPAEPSFPMTEAVKRLVMHARLETEGNVLLFSDVLPTADFIPGNNISLSLQSADKDKLQQWFIALSEGGQVIMPLAETFWSPVYGMLTDRFGITWHINCAH